MSAAVILCRRMGFRSDDRDVHIPNRPLVISRNPASFIQLSLTVEI
jgi:hypothetical protein